jgi:thiol-disulfide isomerase/thioredoxin
MIRLCSFFIIVIVAIASVAYGQNQKFTISGSIGGDKKTDTLNPIQKQYESAFAAYQDEMKSIQLSDTTREWGVNEKITYQLPQSSRSLVGSSDTLYCVISSHAFGGNPTLCMPMNRISDSVFTCEYIIPDSTLEFSMKIYTLRDQLTGKRIGISFNCKTEDGKELPNSAVGAGKDYAKALIDEVKMSPWYYATYANWDENAEQGAMIGTNDASVGDIQDEVRLILKKLESQPETTPGKYLVMSKLYSRLDDGESASLATLWKAAVMKTYDDGFDDDYFWQRFHLQSATAHILSPLVILFPKTKMAQAWIETEAFDPSADADAYKKVTDAWSDSHNTSMLKKIGRGYDFTQSPVYDPAVSLRWLGKAEESLLSRSGFFSGEDVYGCQTGNLPDLLRSKVYALARAGNPDSAITVGKNAFVQAKEKQDMVGLQMALGFAYLLKGDTANAKKCCGIGIAMGAPKIPDEIGLFYDKFKTGDETKEDFADRMADTYGKDIPNPYEFNYATLDGTKGALHSLKGKVVFLDFWFIGCEGCELEKKSISDLADSYKNNSNVVFLSIAYNNKEALAQYLAKVKYDLPVVPDADGEISQKFDVEGYPTHVIIGRNGTVFDSSTGGSNNIGDILRPKIEKALAAN